MAAEGYARVTNTPGLLNVTTGLAGQHQRAQRSLRRVDSSIPMLILPAR